MAPHEQRHRASERGFFVLEHSRQRPSTEYAPGTPWFRYLRYDKILPWTDLYDSKWRSMLMTKPDSTSSTLNPTLSSNYNSPTLSATSNQPGQDPSAIQVAGAETSASLSGASTEAQGKAAEGTVGPAVPIRSSSNAHGQTSGETPTIEQTVTNPISNSRRGSKGSIKPKSRTGSVASRGSKEKANPIVADDQTKAGDQIGPLRKKKRGGLLSILNCCSAPEDANTVELGDQEVPAKKVPQSKAGRQSTPMVKHNASAGESSTGEPLVAEESIGGPEYSELKPAAKPTMITGSSKERVTTEKPSTQTPLSEPAAETKETSAPATLRDAQPSPLHTTNIPSQDGKNDPGAVPAQADGIAAPPQLIEPEESVAQQGTTINDRTPQHEQRDSDIAMVDAPLVAPAADAPSTSTRELIQAQTNLPPPPPRNGQDRAASSSNAVVPNEKKQWLLPPLQPHFKGRKCLVLDLDETLVHSSFKVHTPAGLHVIDLT